MLRLKQIKIGLAASLLMIAQCAFSASVFKISKDDNVLYLGGTFHILTKEDYPLAAPYVNAFEQADAVYFETDIAAMESPEFAGRMQAFLLQPSGQQLSDQLNDETNTALNKFLAARQLPAANFQALTSGGVSLTLTVLDYQLKGFTEEGVDKFFHTKSLENDKPVGWLESIEFQVELIGSLNDLEPNDLINYTIQDLAKGSDVISQSQKAWRTGDMDLMADVAITDWKAEYPSVYADFITKRNNAWYPQITNMLEDKQVEYVLVGALHLAGEDGRLPNLH